MKIYYPIHYILLLSLILLASCSNNNKPKRISVKNGKPIIQLPDKQYLHQVNGKPVAILRLECKNCQLIYTVNRKKEIMDVSDGNEDRFIFPKKNTYVKTILHANENQMIRVIAFNPNGKIISNKLDSFKKGDSVSNEYLMTYTKSPKTIIINRMVSNANR
jgi:hypothetical protein